MAYVGNRTYWYHSHQTAQYPDGLRGALIVQDPKNPYRHMYDEEIVLTLSDWYHAEMPQVMEQFWNVANPTGAEPGMLILSACTRNLRINYFSSSIRSSKRQIRSQNSSCSWKDLLSPSYQSRRLRRTILLDRRPQPQDHRTRWRLPRAHRRKDAVHLSSSTCWCIVHR